MEYPLLSASKALSGSSAQASSLLVDLLLWHGGATVLGVKPAHLLRIYGQLGWLWKGHGPHVCHSLSLRWRLLLPPAGDQQLLLYHPAALHAVIQGKATKAFLTALGYPDSPALQPFLNHLADRFRQGFPHEIGVFLGYPLKDVIGFMGLADLPLSRKTPWRIYGPATPSLRLAARYEQARWEALRLYRRRPLPPPH